MIKVTLKDGSVREFENEVSVMDIAKSISEGLARAVVAASVNGKVVGLNHIVKEDCELNDNNSFWTSKIIWFEFLLRTTTCSYSSRKIGFLVVSEIQKI